MTELNVWFVKYSFEFDVETSKNPRETRENWVVTSSDSISDLKLVIKLALGCGYIGIEIESCTYHGKTLNQLKEQ